MSFRARCPVCGHDWDCYPELLGETASTFANCAFRCEECGIAYSNATTPADRVQIVREPEQNVPPEVRGPDRVLASAFNVRNRSKKRDAFCSESSEDAIVWTVASALRAARRLQTLTDWAPRGVPELLLWGANDGSLEGKDLTRQLTRVSAALKERTNGRSEPDAVLAWPDHLVFIEAKYLSDNDRKPSTYGGWSTYLPAPDLFTVADEAIRQAGWYELVRNWVIGNRVAEQRQSSFTLVNLGGENLNASAREFAAQLAPTKNRRFTQRSWDNVLTAAKPIPVWLDEYSKQRALRDI